MIQSRYTDQCVVIRTFPVAYFLQVLPPRNGVTGVMGWTPAAAHSWQLNSNFKADSALVLLCVRHVQVKMN